MKNKEKLFRGVYVTGIVAMIIGAIDPLEGSVLIVLGSGLIALVTYYQHDRHRKIFMAAFVMIVTGVGFMFYFSSLGGFPPLSWWLSPLMLPYPVGWLIMVITLITRGLKKKVPTVTG